MLNKKWIKYIIYLALASASTAIGIISKTSVPVIFLNLLGNIVLVLYIEGFYIANFCSPVYNIGLIILSMQQHLYGQVISTVFVIAMAITMAIVWAKKTNDGIVKARKMSVRFSALVLVGWIVAVAAGYLVMWLFDSTARFLNSIQMVSKIYASCLLLLRLYENQGFYMAADAASLGMWIVTGNFAMVAQCGVALLYDAQGIYNWKRMANESGEVYLASFERGKKVEKENTR